MKLSIIIVSWNTAELTLKCLKSIFKYINLDGFSRNSAGPASGWEVFLVDNNSTDKTTELTHELTHEHENLHVIANEQNLGFAKANNQALRLVLSEAPVRRPLRSRESEASSLGGGGKDPVENHYILLLNSDTELIDNSLNKMIEFMDGLCEEPRDPSTRSARSGQAGKIGIAGSQLLNTDGTLQRSCRKFPTLIDQIFIQLKFYNFLPEKIKSVREYFMLNFNYDEICQVDQVMGAAMLVRREVFEQIGLLDEEFWSTFEEVDFCKRAKDVGWQVYFFPNTKIVHHKGASFKQMASLKKQINFNHSLYHYFRKHKPFWQLFILWLVQPINLLLMWIDSMVGVRKRVGKKKDL